MQNATATLESSMAVSHKVKPELILSNNPTPLSKRNENLSLHKKTCILKLKEPFIIAKN